MPEPRYGSARLRLTLCPMDTPATHYILQYRKAAGMTQQELSDKSGVSRSQIAKFESGRRSPSLMQIAFLAAALQIEQDILIGRPPERKRRLEQYEKRMSHAEVEELAEIAELILRRRDREATLK